MYKTLTKIDRAELLLSHNQERDKQIADRTKVSLYDDGWTVSKIAETLFIDEATVRRHLSAYKKEKKINLKHKDSEPRLTAEESEALSAHLESHIYVKIKDIRTYVKQTFGKDLGNSTLYECRAPDLLTRGRANLMGPS